MLPLHHDPGMYRSGVCVWLESSSRHSNPVGTAGFEPAISCSQGRRIARLSHVPAEGSFGSYQQVAPGRYVYQTPTRRRMFGAGLKNVRLSGTASWLARW